MANMGRPREFDMNEALAAMMNVFWDKGYEGTSLSDLMEATGLQKGSIYKAFADKHDMFQQSLQYYVKQCHEDKRAVVAAADSPIEGVEEMLKKVIAESCGKANEYRGCLAVNSMMDAQAHDEAVVSILKSTISSSEKALTEVIEGGQQAGDIRTDVPARELAEALYCYIAGMLATARISRTKARTERLVSFAVLMLRPPKKR